MYGGGAWRRRGANTKSPMPSGQANALNLINIYTILTPIYAYYIGDK